METLFHLNVNELSHQLTFSGLLKKNNVPTRSSFSEKHGQGETSGTLCSFPASSSWSRCLATENTNRTRGAQTARVRRTVMGTRSVSTMDHHGGHKAVSRPRPMEFIIYLLNLS